MADEAIGLCVGKGEIGEGAQLDADGGRQAEEEDRLAVEGDSGVEPELCEDLAEQREIAPHHPADALHEHLVAGGEPFGEDQDRQAAGGAQQGDVVAHHGEEALLRRERPVTQRSPRSFREGGRRGVRSSPRGAPTFPDSGGRSPAR